MRTSSTPSKELCILIEHLQACARAQTVMITRPDFERLIKTLSAIKRSVISLERETGALRLAETSSERLPSADIVLVSPEIAEIRQRLQKTAMEGMTPTVLEQREITHRLQFLEAISRNQEGELLAWRFLEAKRKGTEILNDLATEALDALPSTGATVIRPNFRKGDGDAV